MKAVRDATARAQPEGETLRFMQRLWTLSHAMDVRSKAMARTLGVTGPQRLVIRLIGQRPEASARQLADTLGMHPSTLTGILARLEAHKAIVRRTDPEDRRVARFRLTAEGERINHERRGTVEAAVRRALGRADAVVIRHAMDMLDLVTSELEHD